MKRCLFCYQPLQDNEIDFHSSCAKNMFGVKQVPVLPYTRSMINDLALEVIRSQTALTGVQPKLSLNLTRTRNNEPQRFTIVGLWGRYILKPQAVQFFHLPELEDLTMHLAQLSGIKTVPHSLIRFEDGELCYITSRIDRSKNGEKYPMEDMCQLTERLTEHKYKGSYEQIAKAVLKYSITPKLDVVNFWEQVLFSWLTGNTDMHLKNFSLYAVRPGSYTLAPAYDMLSTTLVMPEDKEELALTLNGKKRKITIDDFKIAMRKSFLEDKIIENLFAKFQKTYSSWLDFINISFLTDDMKSKFKNLIKDKINSIPDKV